MSENDGEYAEINQLECRTYDPNVAKWTSVADAAEKLGIRAKRIYGWVYQGKIGGAKKEGGQLLIPACEMTRLLELQKAGTLDQVMWHEAQKAGAQVGRKRRAALKLVSKAAAPAAAKSAEKRREAVQQALHAAAAPQYTDAEQRRRIRIAEDAVIRYNSGLLPETEHEEHLLVIRRGDVLDLVRCMEAATVAADKCGLRVMLV